MAVSYHSLEESVPPNFLDSFTFVPRSSWFLAYELFDLVAFGWIWTVLQQGMSTGEGQLN